MRARCKIVGRNPQGPYYGGLGGGEISGAGIHVMFNTAKGKTADLLKRREHGGGGQKFGLHLSTEDP